MLVLNRGCPDRLVVTFYSNIDKCPINICPVNVSRPSRLDCHISGHWAWGGTRGIVDEGISISRRNTQNHLPPPEATPAMDPKMVLGVFATLFWEVWVWIELQRTDRWTVTHHSNALHPNLCLWSILKSGGDHWTSSCLSARQERYRKW